MEESYPNEHLMAAFASFFFLSQSLVDFVGGFDEGEY
jgi:hypothetical protein